MSTCIRTTTTWALVVFCLGTLWAVPISAAIPNSGPEAFNEKQYRLDLCEFYKKAMSGAYQEVGRRDARWDNLVVELLDSTAIYYANYDADESAKVEQPTDNDRRGVIVDQLKEFGCDDPLARFIIIRYPNDMGPEYDQNIKDIYDSLITSQYPTLWKVIVADAWGDWLVKNGPEDAVGAARQKTSDMAYLLITQPIDVPNNQRLTYQFIQSYMKYMPRQNWRAVHQRADTSDSPNRWLIDMVGGTYHIKAAWDARGNGYANKVTEEGWQGFREHLGEAGFLLDRAWKTFPQHPESADEMIAVAMGGIQDYGNERQWFERAVQAQFDYYPAYTSYLWSIWPRWSGSHAQMYAFGVECLQTGRFDTRVPELFYKAMINIADDDDGYGFWARPGVYESFTDYFDGKRSDPDSTSSPQWWYSLQAAVAWRCNDMQAASEVIKTLGPGFNPKAFERIEGDKVLSPSECFARVTVPPAVFDEARQLWMEDKYRGASEIFQAAIAGMEPGDLARPYLRHLSVWARRLHQQQQDTWIDLLGESDLAGWRDRLGDWSVDEHGRVTGVSDDGGLLLECRLNLGYRIEIQGKITFIDDAVFEGACGGVLLAFRKSKGKYYHRGVLLDPNTGEAESAQNHSWRKRYPAGVGKTNRFHIQMWDEAVRLKVNDKIVYEGLVMRDDLPRTVYPFAIGAWARQAGIGVRFDELKARRLTLEPDWVPGPAEPGGFSRVPEWDEPTIDRVANSGVMRYKIRQVPGG